MLNIPLFVISVITVVVLILLIVFFKNENKQNTPLYLTDKEPNNAEYD